MNTVKFQIGKSGVTPGVISSLALAFKTHKCVRIVLLQASGRTKSTLDSTAQKICEELAKKIPARFDYTTIGFIIILRKHSLK